MNKLAKNKNKTPREKNNPPRADWSGNLQVGESSLPCYVLNDRRRIFSTRGMLESLGYKSNSNPDGVFNSKALAPFMETQGNPYKGDHVVDFFTDTGTNAMGYDVEKFMDICHAYSEAYEAGVLEGRNKDAALKANAIIRACSKIGIVALVDEATGYQYARAENALQFKLKLYLSEEMRAWEKTFPDELWIQFARLTDWTGSPTKNRPKYWGYLVMDLIYGYLDEEVARYIKQNKPKPRKGQNYHQWFNEDFGMRKLTEHINRVIGMAQGCETMDELKQKMAHRYGGKPLQLELFLSRTFERIDSTKIDMPFAQALKKIVDYKPAKEN